MRSLVLILLLLLLSLTGATQTFTVIRIVGKVESRTLKRALQVGDKIQTKDQLTFGSKGAHVFVISAKTGSIKISGVPDSSPREIMRLMEQFMQPEKKTTGTRGFGSDYFAHLRSTLTVDTLLVLGDGEIKVDPSAVSLASPAVVRVTYWSGKEVIIRKISSPTGFLIGSGTLFEGPPPAQLPRVRVIYYYDEKVDPIFAQSVELGAFVPLYVDETAMANELKALTGFMTSDMTNANALDEIKKYLLNAYAATFDDNLHSWLSRQGIVK